MKKLILKILLLNAFINVNCNKRNCSKVDKLNPDDYWTSVLYGGPVKGNVKKIIYKQYQLSEKFGEVSRDSIIRNVVVLFNKNGGIIQMVWHKIKGSNRKSKETFEYDGIGNLIEKNTFQTDENNNLLMGYPEKSIYKHDSYGNKIESTKFKSGGSIEAKYIYKYDSFGNNIESIDYKSDGSRNSKQVKKYDLNRNLIEEYNYPADDKTYSKIIHKYDELGNQIELNYFKSDGSLEGKISYKYNSKCRVSDLLQYKTDGTLKGKVVFTYDDDNLIEENDFEADKLIRKYTWNYDNNRNKIEYVSTRFKSNLEAEEVITTKYEYDKAGNWIKETVLKNGIPDYLTERLIDYYNDKDSENDKKDLSHDSSFAIELWENGIFINSEEIALTSDLNEIKSIIGKPTKEKIPSDKEIKESKSITGVDANNIYTFDDLGILVYQKIGKQGINSFSIKFKKENYSYSPSSPFRGIFKINGIIVNQNTTLNDLKKIPGLIIKSTNVMIETAKFGNQELTFEFNSNEDKNGLVGLSVQYFIPEVKNSKGWTKDDIAILRAVMTNAKKVKLLSSQYNFEISDFVECYLNKVTTTMTKSEVENPTTDYQINQNLEIMQSCINLTSKK